MTARVVDMTGKRYGSAVALRIARPSHDRGNLWVFACDCGAEFEAAGYEARRGTTTCCPRCSSERRSESKKTHGLTEHPLYKIWSAMKFRCFSSSSAAYPDYGGRGITVCERWSESFENFLADMGDRPTPKHTIERKDTNGNYEPGNCIWATRLQQANNKRNNRQITIEGVTKTLAQWAEEGGVTESGIRARLKRGVTGKALLAPDPRSDSLVFNGEKKTLARWAEVTGIKKRTLASRLYVYGWPIERVLTEKVSR